VDGPQPKKGASTGNPGDLRAEGDMPFQGQGVRRVWDFVPRGWEVPIPKDKNHKRPFVPEVSSGEDEPRDADDQKKVRQERGGTTGKGGKKGRTLEGCCGESRGSRLEGKKRKKEPEEKKRTRIAVPVFEGPMGGVE